MAALFRDLVVARRAHPARDLLTELVQVEDQGDRLNDDELVATCVLLLFAGHETTTHHIANGLRALLAFPAELARLRERPDLAASAVEELLRYDGPIGAQVRIVQQSQAVHGKAFAPGERVFLLMNAANRDPRAYEGPDRLDLRAPWRAASHLRLRRAHLPRLSARPAGGPGRPAGAARALENDRACRAAAGMDRLDGVARHEGDAAARATLSGEPDHLPRHLWWVLAALTFAWGFNWTAMKVALSEVPP